MKRRRGKGKQNEVKGARRGEMRTGAKKGKGGRRMGNGKERG